MIVRTYIYPGMKLTEEQKAELEALDNLADEDIDYSDIPPLNEKDFKRMVRVCDLYPDGKVTDLYPERRLADYYKKHNIAT